MLLAGVLNNFVVARLAGPEGKGFLYTLQLFASMALVFANFGIGPATVYHFRRDDGFSVEEITTGLLWPSLLLGCIPLALLVGLRQTSIALFHSGVWNSAAMLAFATVPAFTLVWNLSYLNLAKGEIGRYNLLRASQSCLFALLLIGLVIAHVTQLGVLVATWVASVFVPAAVAIVLLARSVGIWRLPTSRFLKHSFDFGWRSHLGAVVQYLQHRTDVVLVMILLPIRDLGIYSLAISLVELLWYVPQAVSQVLMPHVADSEAGDATIITSAFCRASLAVSALLSVTLALMSTAVIPWLLPAFKESVVLIWVLLPGTVVASIFKVLASDLNGRGEPLKTVFPAATALVFSVAGCCYAIPRYGMIGAAAVTSISYLLNASLYVYEYSRSSSITARSLVLLQVSDLVWYRRLLLQRRGAGV